MLTHTPSILYGLLVYILKALGSYSTDKDTNRNTYINSLSSVAQVPVVINFSLCRNWCSTTAQHTLLAKFFVLSSSYFAERRSFSSQVSFFASSRSCIIFCVQNKCNDNIRVYLCVAVKRLHTSILLTCSRLVEGAWPIANCPAPICSLSRAISSRNSRIILVFSS